MNLKWKFDDSEVDWSELSNLYKIAPLGDKQPDDLKVVFGNSRYKCFVFNDKAIVGVGRALADGLTVPIFVMSRFIPISKGWASAKQSSKNWSSYLLATKK